MATLRCSSQCLRSSLFSQSGSLGDWVKQSIQLALDRHVTEERNTLLPLGL